MAYDEDLAGRVKAALARTPRVEEKRMFGGLTFMVGGHMCCGVVGHDLMLRVGPQAQAEALALPHARAMDFTGRPPKGMVYVGAAGTRADADLEAWLDRALTFVASLPPKKTRARQVS